jgi:hypothetical protein
VETLFAEHRRALQAYFHRRIRTESDAADLAQEVYIRMLRVSDTLSWSGFELAAFLCNALNSHPALTGRSAAVTNIGAPMAVTLVPRTLSISGTWHF